MDTPKPTAPEAIAIVGLGARLPGARTVAEFWRNLCGGVESITFFSDEELLAAGIDPALVRAPNYVKARGVLGNTDLFDAAFFGMNPREAALMDPQHRLFMECAWEAMESAGYSPERQPGRVGVFGGQSMNTYLLTNIYSHLAHVASVESLQASIGNDKDSLTTEVAYRLDLKGPAVTIQSSSSTSLTAIHYACQSLLGYECDMALAGGVSIHFPETAGYLYYEGGTTAPDGHCRVFDARAEGFVAGHGAAVVVLRRLSDALESGDTIYAVVRGSAVNNDGSAKVSYMAPSVDGQAEVIALAQAVADASPDTIGYVEAHGTATRMGDPIEVAALTQAFRQGTDRTGYCALGSAKSNIGHLDSAAGAVGLMKAALILHHKRIPPSLHYETPNPAIDFEHSPFFVNTELRDWPAGPVPRRAGVTSLGMGGTNAHCVLEEVLEQPQIDAPRRPAQLLVVSARSETALETLTGALAEHLNGYSEHSLGDVAYTLQVGRKRFAHRRIVVCQTREEALTALAGHDPARVLSGVTETTGRPVMWMFSGQGSQYVDMGRQLYETEPVFRAEVDACAERLHRHLGLDLRTLLYPPAAERETAQAQLTQTSITQPALFVIEYALARLWQSWGIEPKAMIGHSIGEYVAACLAGVFTPEDALALVAARGRLMQKMPPGAMVAVPLPEAEVVPLLAHAAPGTHAGSRLSLAAVNSPTTAVVAGPIPEVDAFIERLSARGVHCTKLHTSHAFHSSMMEPILTEFREEVRRVARRAPELPYISNVTGTWITAEEATSPDYWTRHLRQAVRFATGVGELLKDPDAILLEVGPGQTLSTLARQHPGRQPHHVVLPSLRHPREQQPDSAFLLGTLGRLWLAGVEPDWDGYYGEERRRRVPLPTYPFERQRHWVEPKESAGKAQAAEASAGGEKLPLERWFYLPAWKPTPLLRSGAWRESCACWWVFAPEPPGGIGIGPRLIERLREAGQEVVTVSPGPELAQLGPDQWSIPVGGAGAAEAYRALVERLLAAGRVPGRIVHLWNARTERPDIETALDRGFYSLLFLGQALDRQRQRQRHGAPLSLVVVTERMQGLGGAAPCPELATVLGPCRVLPQEYPHITCQAVDVALPAPHQNGSWQEAALIEQILGECAAGTRAEPVVAYRGSRRWVQAFEAVAPGYLGAQPLPLREQGVYLVLGGLGHIGYVQALMLARRARARLVLVGRSALPERAGWDAWLAGHAPNDPASRKIRKVQALEALGAEVMVAHADVADRAQLKAVVDEARARFGALHGVLYSAGTVDEGLFRALRDTRPSEMQAHLRARLHGLYALAEVLQGQRLDFCLLASSLAAVLGGLGLGTYAAATSFMDAFARARAEESPTPWLSVDWDAWQFEAGVESPVGGQNPFGERAITDEEGERACETLLTLGVTGQVAVSTHALAWRLARWNRPDVAEEASVGTAAEAAIVPSAPGERAPRPQLQNAYVGPRNELETAIAQLWEDTLGIDRVGVYDNFFELGGNSLVGVRLIARTREQFGVSIPAVSLYEGPTVQALANLIRQSRGEAEAEAPETAESAGGRSRGERRRARRQRRGGEGVSASAESESEGEGESNS